MQVAALTALQQGSMLAQGRGACLMRIVRIRRARAVVPTYPRSVIEPCRNFTKVGPGCFNNSVGFGPTEIRTADLIEKAFFSFRTKKTFFFTFEIFRNFFSTLLGFSSFSGRWHCVQTSTSNCVRQLYKVMLVM